MEKNEQMPKRNSIIIAQIDRTTNSFSPNKNP